MKAEVVTIKAAKGAICRMCTGDDKVIKKGLMALKVSAKSAKSPWSYSDSFYCVTHGRHILLMFADLTI